MVHQPISGYGRRCGFNSLTHFFFGVEDAVEWEVSQTGSPLSLVIFSALLLEQKLLQNKTIGHSGTLVRDTYITGLQFYTMKTIIRAFSRYQGNSTWIPLEENGLYCFYNEDFAVAHFRVGARESISARHPFSLSKAVEEIPAKVVFVLYRDHWTVFYNNEKTVPIPQIDSEERRERVEFMANLFVNCVGSLAPCDSIASYILDDVVLEAERYSTGNSRNRGISPARFVWGIYRWVLGTRTVLDIDINEASQLLTSYYLVDPTISGFPINENYMVVLDKDYDKDAVFTRNEKEAIEKIACDYTNLLSHKPVNRALFANKKPKDFNVEFYRRVSGIFTLLGKLQHVALAVTLEQALNNSSTQQTVDRFSHIHALYTQIFSKLPEGQPFEKYFNLGVGGEVEEQQEDNLSFEKLVLFGCFETALSLYLATGEKLSFGKTPVDFVRARDIGGNEVDVGKTVADVLKAVLNGITIEI